MFKSWYERKESILDAPSSVRSTSHRLYLRSLFVAPAQLTLQGRVFLVRVLDLSLKGARVDCAGLPQNFSMGTSARLRLRLAPTMAIGMGVTIMRRQDRELGLRCDQIDLDSFTHLRELLERNASDPGLVQQDLVRLIGNSPALRRAA